MSAIYSIYKKDDLLFTGTAKECSEHFNVKIKTIYDWACPSTHKRADVGRMHNGKMRKKETTGVKVAVRLDKEYFDD